MTVREVPFSEIQNKGKATLSEWQRSGARPLRLTRRDDEDLVLMTAARAAQEREILTAATAMIAALLRSDHRDLFRAVVEAAFPWAIYLSNEEAFDFIEELVASLRAGSSLDNPAPTVRTIEMWRHAAEIHADPELARILSTPSEGASRHPEVSG